MRRWGKSIAPARSPVNGLDDVRDQPISFPNLQHYMHVFHASEVLHSYTMLHLTTSYFASCLKIQFGTPSSQDWMVASVICHSRSSCSISRPQSPFVHSSPKVALHHKEYLGRRLNSTLPSNHCLNVSQIHKYLHTSRIWSVTRRSESWQTEALMVNCITCVLKTKIGFELVKTCAAFPLCHISDSLRYFHSVFTHVTCEICQ